MANKHKTLKDLFDAIANAIRAKTGSNDGICADDFPDVIATISTGTDTDDATASAGDLLDGKTAYSGGTKITGTIPTNDDEDVTLNGADISVKAGYYETDVSKTIPSVDQAAPSVSVNENGLVTATVTQASGYVNGGTETRTTQLTKRTSLSKSKNVVTANAGYYPNAVSATVTEVTQATPSISINSSGLITAIATQAAGYVAAGTTSATKQLTTQAAKTIVPGTEDQIIPGGTYLTGRQIINGTVNLKAENIKSGVGIFGVTGTYTGTAHEFTKMKVTLTNNTGHELRVAYMGSPEKTPTRVYLCVSQIKAGGDANTIYICVPDAIVTSNLLGIFRGEATYANVNQKYTITSSQAERLDIIDEDSYNFIRFGISGSADFTADIVVKNG